MNSYIYEITNMVTKEQYIGIRKCNGDIYADRYKGEDTFISKYFRKYGKKNFNKRVLAIITNEQIEKNLIELYMKDSDYILIDDSSIAEFKVKRSTVGAKNGASRKVICLNTGEIFDTIAEASRKYNANATGIVHACNPNSERTVAGKDENGEYLRWSYYDAYLAELNGEKYIYTGSKMGPKNKKTTPVRCLETGEEFDSITEAAKVYNTSTGSVSSSCKRFNSAGKHPITGERLHWEYINKEDNKYYDERYAGRF